MTRQRTARYLVEAVLDDRQDCDAALEYYLHEFYRGPLNVPSITNVHLALCCFNAGQRDRVLELKGGPMTVQAIIEEFGLAPWLPLFDRKENARFTKGQLVRYGNEYWGYDCRVLGRRAVTPFAMPRFDDWEVFLDTLDGKIAGFVGEGEVEAMDTTDSMKI